jgi:hypothetical protein
MASAKATIDHEVIRKWAEERGGKPATVIRTESSKGEPGILRIDFPGYSGEGTLEEISWGDFFEKFEEKKLAMLFQDRTANGKRSRFNKLVSRDTVTEDTEIVESEGDEMDDEDEGQRRPSHAA